MLARAWKSGPSPAFVLAIVAFIAHPLVCLAFLHAAAHKPPSNWVRGVASAVLTVLFLPYTVFERAFRAAFHVLPNVAWGADLDLILAVLLNSTVWAAVVWFIGALMHRGLTRRCS